MESPAAWTLSKHESTPRESRIFASPRRPHTSSPARTVVIVGAGFSGTAVAIHLLRLPHAEPLRIVLVERGQIGRGVAYAKRASPYLLNVPASRMSLSSREPLQFLSYAQRSLPQATAEDFLPRELYGEYLEASLSSAAQAAPPHRRLERVRGEVIAIEKPHRSSCVRVHLHEGSAITAHTAVLAPGNPGPATLPGGEKLAGARYVADPWQSPPAFRAAETVLVVGTGLTMADIVLAGQEAAQDGATIHALSRHGLLPACQTDFHQVHDDTHGRALLRGTSVSVRRLVREVRALAEDIELRGGDWREAITAVRNVAPLLWQNMTTGERRRFLRHVRCYWDVHRHRLPQATWSALNELRRKGRLQIHAGRLLGMEQVERKVRVTWRARGASAATTLLVDRVVNCTGPQYDARHPRERLLRSLIAQGMAMPDALGQGLVTDELGGLVDASGRPAGNLYYIGPMLRPRFWETTAVQELRTHAEQLAHHVAVWAGSRLGWATSAAVS
jgi:uncharacterized NAD(P)/FAD-binding protein YdhS